LSNNFNETNFLLSLRQKITQSATYIKWTNWEYWPIWLANIPTVLIIVWFAMRARKPIFFSAVNPVIETGGMMGESKINILNRIPQKYVPTTLFIPKHTPIETVLNQVSTAQISYPLITKPNVGERGLLVAKIDNETELLAYFKRNTAIDILVQAFVDYPNEVAILYHRFPGAKQGKVTSICVKESMTVRGDGESTVLDLMLASERSSLQVERFQKDFPTLLKAIPNKGEQLLLEPIGNHSRGTKFLDGNAHITPAMHRFFDEVTKDMDGIHYGRFDMKCHAIEDILNERFKVLEYNGVASEPAHIYDPQIPILQKYKVVYQHWKIIFEIYKVQRKNGVKAMSVREMWQSLQAYNAYMKSLAK